ncbi:MAG: 50S ribosomal protein L22 [Deltaproteobacteria bacterium]|jgi:large subunit ribosomal protein L22|nr:50S ribosomal protein L22 [Deltaproteobacteria bacterium]
MPAILAKDTKKVRAVGKFLRIPADKARIMARTVVGRPVDAAINALTFSPNKSAYLILKVLKSAVANATANAGPDQKTVDVDSLVVSSIFVDRGPSLKRYQPCAHGRAKPILKRLSHITVVVEGQKA